MAGPAPECLGVGVRCRVAVGETSRPRFFPNHPPKGWHGDRHEADGDSFTLESFHCSAFPMAMDNGQFR